MGGSTDTRTSEPPAWFNDAAIKALEVADKINQAGYVPYQGNQVAGFTPMQQQAMQSTSDWASAANGTPTVNAMAGVPKATVDASGVAGYSSYPGLIANLKKLRATMPAQYHALTQFGGNLLTHPTQTPGSVPNSPWNVGGAASAAYQGQQGIVPQLQNNSSYGQYYDPNSWHGNEKGGR